MERSIVLLAARPHLPKPPIHHPMIPVPQHRSPRAIIIVLLITLALLVLGSGAGVLYYTTVPYPAELHVQATAVVQNILAEQAQATAAVNALSPQDFYTWITSKKSAISDPMNNPAAFSWPSFSVGSDGCSFSGGAYHVRVSEIGTIGPCPALLGNDYSNFIFQVQMTIIKGDAGGLLFRGTGTSSGQAQSYGLAIARLGTYNLFLLQSGLTQTLKFGPLPALNPGPNEIAVLAHGSNFYFFLNKHPFATLSDSSYKSGGVGVFAVALRQPTEVAFSNMQMWLF